MESLFRSIPTLLTRKFRVQFLQEGRGNITVANFPSHSSAERFHFRARNAVARSVHQITMENEGTCVITKKDGGDHQGVETG